MTFMLLTWMFELKFELDFLIWELFWFLIICSFRVGYRWITGLLALLCYAMLLLPGFLQGKMIVMSKCNNLMFLVN